MKTIKWISSTTMIVLFWFFAINAANAAIIWDDFSFRYAVDENSADIYNVNNNRFEPETTLQGPTPQSTNTDEETDPVDSHVDSSSPNDPSGLGLQLKAGAGGRHLSNGARIEGYIVTSTTSGGVLFPYAIGSPGIQKVFAFSNRNFHVNSNQLAILSGIAGGVINDPGFSSPPFLRADYDWGGDIILDEIATIDGNPILINSWLINFDDMLNDSPQEVPVNLRTQDGSGNSISYTLRTRLDLESLLLNYDFQDENQAGNIPVGKLGSLGALNDPLWIDASIAISTEPVLSAAFIGNPLLGPSPLLVNFTDQSIGDITAWQWNFGDGSPVSNEENPSHSFTTAGTYTVSLTVTGPLGSDTETKTDYITVQTAGTPPNSAFTGNPLTGPSPLQVNFTDQSTGDITAWQWNFGDGSPLSNEENPSHSFTTAGTYTVSLTATGPLGSDTETKTNYITVGTAPNAAFTGNPLDGPSPLQVNFTDQSTGDISSRQWNFGDGSPASNDTNPSHTFANPGTYTVSLTVTGPLGSDTETKTNYITVQTAGTPPNAAFTGTPLVGPSPLLVDFTDQSTGDISSRQWNFGDGSPVSNDKNPSHSFATAGTYTISLTVIGPLGSDTESKTNYITVQTAGTPPNAAFTGNPLGGPSPLQVNFTDRSTGEISSHQWNFGDGLLGSNDKNPTHVYSEIGSYTVSLRVTGPLGSDTETKTDYITVTCPAGTYTISGYIYDTDDIPLEGISIEADNCGSSDTTNFDGYYEILVPADWSGKVTLFSKEGYIFNPTRRTYTDVATDMADQDYSGRLDIQISDLVAYYPFNGYADDVSGNDNHGVARGASLTLDRFATANTAYRFDGRLDYIVIPKSASLQPVNAFTIAAWSMPLGFYSGTCQANAVLYNGTDQDIGFYGIGFSDRGYAPDCSVFAPDKQTFFFEIKFNDGTSEYINAQDFINPDKWYSVVATYDGKAMKIYVNGALKNVLTVEKQLGNNNDSLTIGTQLVSSYPYWVNGKIDDVRIYSRALTLDEVEELFEYEKPLDFNECLGDFDEDGNVDGDDLFELAEAEKDITLKSFGEEFGRIDCD